MKILLFLTLILTQLVRAQDTKTPDSDYNPLTDDIASNYMAGAYLIYDCKEKHWICVLESHYKECSETRTRELASVDDPYHSCAMIEKFPTKKSCFQRQLFLVTHDFGQRFCIKDSFRVKNIEF